MSIWVFDVLPHERSTLRLLLASDAVRSGVRGQQLGARGVLGRAQAAKALLDATYPETQPQDYDQVTWLSGVGVRLSRRPANYTNELDALHKTAEAATTQLKGETSQRVSTPSNRERLRNATALVSEYRPSDLRA